MKNSFLFKSLIDIFFFLHVIGLIAILMRIPMGFIAAENIEPLQLDGWIILIFKCIIAFIFLRGLFFLRKIARVFLLKNTFTKNVANYMKITGNHFTYAGLISVLIILSEKFFNLNFDPVLPIPKSFSINPIFLIIVGLFFTIQSQTLRKAIKIKDENDLMV